MSNSLKLIEITDKNKWNDFVGAQPHAEFLQSWEWGEFQEKAEGKIIRLGVEENGGLIAVATLVKKSLPGGLVLRSLGVGGMNYFYCPRGPVFNEELRIKKEELINFFVEEIKKIAQKEKVIFLRLEPHVIASASRSNPGIASSPAAGLLAMTKTLDIQPSQTIILDLIKSEDELLAAMHQKTRYNIRLAEKKGVIIKNSPLACPAERSDARERGADPAKAACPEPCRRGCVKAECFEKFWDLMKKTSGRDGFTPHSQDYYEKLLQTSPENFKLFFAVYEGKIISAGIFSFFGDTATYLFGASSDENREVMAPYLLQWELIKRGKAGGYKYYDFFGIDEKKWPGVTRFKRGFSGEQINYPGTFDVIFDSSKYLIYKSLRFIRRFF